MPVLFAAFRICIRSHPIVVDSSIFFNDVTAIALVSTEAGKAVVRLLIVLWRDILNDRPFLEDVAKYWILPIAAGYGPVTFWQNTVSI
jgi:hypothetical protein